jgi:hypothetical protein
MPKLLPATHAEKWVQDVYNMDASQAQKEKIWLSRMRTVIKRAGDGVYRESQKLNAIIERYNQILRLRKLIKPGDTIYTTLDHVSASGMMRHITAHVIKKNRPIMLNYAISVITDTPMTDRGSLKIGGCGMDMGFHVVYSLSYCLYRYGVKCTGPGCNSNDHNNGDQDYTTPRNHGDGGYAINQSWL